MQACEHSGVYRAFMSACAYARAKPQWHVHTRAQAGHASPQLRNALFLILASCDVSLNLLVLSLAFSEADIFAEQSNKFEPGTGLARLRASPMRVGGVAIGVIS